MGSFKPGGAPPFPCFVVPKKTKWEKGGEGKIFQPFLFLSTNPLASAAANSGKGGGVGEKNVGKKKKKLPNLARRFLREKRRGKR